MIPEERLALKTDHVKRWRTCVPKAAGDLSFRPHEQSKSSWAFNAQHSDQLEDAALGQDPQQRDVVLHAISFLLHDCSRGNARNKIEGVSFRRDPIEGSVAEQPGSHAVSGLDDLHRSIQSTDDASRLALLDALCATNTITEWRYTTVQLLNPLRRLLEADRIKEQFKAVAASIVEQKG